MRRSSVLTIIMALMLSFVSFGSIISTQDAEGVGPVAIMMFSTGLDYPGGPESEPVDLLEGNPPGSYDPDQGPVKTISIDAEVGIESNTPHLLQDVVFHFEVYDETGWNDEMLYLDFTTEPEQVVFERVLPGREYWMNVTFNINLTRFMGAGSDEIFISKWYSVSPGIAGGDVIFISGMPIEILPFVDGDLEFDSGVTAGEVSIEEGETEEVEFEIKNYGNVEYPEFEVEILGLDQAQNGGIQIESLIFSGGETGTYRMTISSMGATPGATYELELRLKDPGNGTYLGTSLFFDIYIEEEKPDQPDDPATKQPGRDEDKDIDYRDIELLDSSCCQRQYDDRKGDEVYILGSIYKYEYELGTRPQVDARSMNVWRENNDLHIKVLTGDHVEGWTVMMVYILPDDKNKQRDYYADDLEDATFLEYEPHKVLASNDMFAKGSYWPVTIERDGNSITAIGALRDLMEAGLDENFEVFVQLVDLDPELLLMEDIYELEIEMVVDYIGSGAGKVKDSSIPDPDKPSLMVEPGDIGGILIKALIGLVVLFLVVILVAFIVVKTTKKKKK